MDLSRSIFVFQFILIYIISIIFMDAGIEFSSPLLAFVISMLFFLYGKQVGILAFIVFLKSLIYQNIIPPINDGGDTGNFHSMMLSYSSIVDGINMLVSNIQNGYFSSIPPVGFMYYLESTYLNSKDIYILIFFNHILFFIASILFFKTLVHTKFIDKKYFFVFIMLLNLSPLVNMQISLFLKESFILFFISVFLYFYIVKKNYFILPIVLIFATMMRQYFAIILLSYYWFFFGHKYSKKLFIIMVMILFTFLLYYQGDGENRLLYIRGILASYGIFLASPNFLKPINWTEHTFATVEALILFIAYVYLFFSKEKYKYTIFQVLIIYSLALGTVAVNETKKYYEKSGKIMQEDASIRGALGRKKTPIIFINYYVGYIFYRRIRRKKIKDIHRERKL